MLRQRVPLPSRERHIERQCDRQIALRHRHTEIPKQPGQGSAEVALAPSGSFALTMLEWTRHDVVVSRARIDDMNGHELCAILKSDPGTRDGLALAPYIRESRRIRAVKTIVEQ